MKPTFGEILRMARRFCSDYDECDKCPVNKMCLRGELLFNENKQTKVMQLYEIHYGEKDVTEEEVVSILNG